MLKRINTLLRSSLRVLREEGPDSFFKKVYQRITPAPNSNTPLNSLTEAQEIAFGGERVTHLYPNDLYYAHLSIYWFASQFVEGKVILDAGCGDGYGTNYLAEHGAKQIVGIDISQVAINACRKYFSHDNLRYQVVDLAEIGNFDTYKDHSVDLIFSSNALEHVSPARPFFHRCHELLTADGTFILAVPPVVDEISREANIVNPYHLNIWSPAQWKFALSLYFDEIQCYTHIPNKPGVQLNFGNAPEDTKIRESDFEFRQIPVEKYYKNPEENLTIIFLAGRPKSASAIPDISSELPMIDDSFTREFSL